MKRSILVLAFIFALAPAAAYAANDDQMMCTAIYQPVCAAQQVECFAAPCYPVYHTYGNACTANSANAPVIHEGECTAAESGPVKPVTPYQPPRGCITWNDGCNSCGMSGNGGAVCTQMACTGPTKPGYCTAYAATTTPHTTAPGTATSSPVASTTIDATTTVTVHVGFFARIWHAFLNWF